MLTEAKMPDGFYTTALKATVSISKLTSFCESKGIAIEVKGALFAFNITQKELNKKSEEKTIEDLINITRSLAPKMFNYALKSEEIVKSENNANYSIPLEILYHINDNYAIFYNLLINTLKSISLTEEENNDYIALKIPTYFALIATNTKQVKGEFEYFFTSGSNNDREIDRAKFIEFNRSRLNEPNKYYGYWTMVKEKNYNFNKVNSNVFYFRSPIAAKLEIIMDIIMREGVLNYSIISNNAKLNHTASSIILINPITSANNPGNEHRDVIIDGLPAFKSKLFQTLFKNYNSVSHKTHPMFYLCNFEVGAEIGFSLTNIELQLSEMKNISKLEIHPYK